VGEHGEEPSQDIMELEALCKRLREDAQKLKEEKAKLEGMVEFHDELIMVIANETGLDHRGDDAEEEEEDQDDRGDATTHHAATRSRIPALRAVAMPEEIIIEEGPLEMVPE
jgi:hypothetical protein